MSKVLIIPIAILAMSCAPSHEEVIKIISTQRVTEMEEIADVTKSLNAIVQRTCERGCPQDKRPWVPANWAVQLKELHKLRKLSSVYASPELFRSLAIYHLQIDSFFLEACFDKKMSAIEYAELCAETTKAYKKCTEYFRVARWVRGE